MIKINKPANDDGDFAADLANFDRLYPLVRFLAARTAQRLLVAANDNNPTANQALPSDSQPA